MSTTTTVFTEAFLTRALPIFKEVTLAAIRNFNIDAYPPMALIAGCGALVASAMLYAFGIWLRRMPERVSTDAQRARVGRMEKHAHEWLPWLLILAPTPLGTALIIAAGFFGVRVRVAGLVLIAAEVAYRLSPLLHR